MNTGWRAFDQRVQRRINTLMAMPRDEAVRTVVRDALNRAPVVMFLILPLFALLMKILYIRHRRYYVEHFIFALHLHAFWFSAFAVMLLLSTDLVSTLMTLWILIYVFVAMRRVYGQGMMKTTLKYIALASIYPTFLLAGVAATLVIALLAE